MGIVKFNVLMQCLNGYLKYAFYFEQMQMTNNQPQCAYFDLCHFTFYYITGPWQQLHMYE